MGSWGVTERESDYGLDLLGMVVDQKLKEIDFEYFNLPEIKEFLKQAILDEIRQTNCGCSQEELDCYIAVMFPPRYESAIILVAECLVDYLTAGKLTVDLYDRVKHQLYPKEVKTFQYTQTDLKILLDELRQILDPQSASSQSWKGSAYKGNWEAHIQSLCTAIQLQIGGEAK